MQRGEAACWEMELHSGRTVQEGEGAAGEAARSTLQGALSMLQMGRQEAGPGRVLASDIHHSKGGLSGRRPLHVLFF